LADRSKSKHNVSEREKLCDAWKLYKLECLTIPCHFHYHTKHQLFKYSAYFYCCPQFTISRIVELWRSDTRLMTSQCCRNIHTISPCSVSEFLQVWLVPQKTTFAGKSSSFFCKPDAQPINSIKTLH